MSELARIEEHDAMPFSVAPATQTTPEEPSRALFHVGPQVDEVVGNTNVDHERNFGIQSIQFNRFFGTMVLSLNDKKTLPRLIEAKHMEEYTAFGFKPKDDLHITVLNYENGRRILDAFGGNRKVFAAVENEAGKVDWSWKPTGVFVPFQGKRRETNVLKLITIVECPGSEIFYRELESQIDGLQLERHPMHITLMRRSGEYFQNSNAVIGGVAVRSALRTLDQFKPAYGGA